MSALDDFELPRSVASRAIEAAADAFKVSPDDLIGPRRARRFVRPRQIAIGMLRETVRGHGGVWSLPEIAKRFGGRDHTTILHAARCYRRWCAAAGLEPAPGNFADRAQALAAVLGVPPLPAREKYKPTKPVSEETAMPEPETKQPASEVAVAAPRPPAKRPRVPQGFAPDLGVFAITFDDWLNLPPAMQAEGAALAIERCGGSIDAASRMTGLSPSALARALEASPDPHDLPRAREQGPEPFVSDPDRPWLVADPSGEPDPGFLTFAQIHLVAGDSLEVPAAYATYQAFCRHRESAALPRSSFGAALLALARRQDGGRSGDRLTGLSLRDGRPAPVHRAPPEPKRPQPKPPRAPLQLGIAAPEKRGHRLVIIGEGGSRLERRVLA